MIKEEIAKEYRKDLKSKFFLSEPQLDLACQGFIDGFLAGRPQWHYLTEDPNDLPDTDRDVWVKRESEIECQIDNYYADDKGWGIMFREGYCTDDVIAWCELPTFDKE